MSESLPVESPCIGVCRMDARANVCAGCLRTRDEIAAWSRMSSGEKRQLLNALERRLAESVSFD